MQFLVKDSNIFLLPGNPHMLHLGTISYGLKEFIVMHCIKGPKKGNTYIEEIVLNTVDFSNDVFANLKFIKDDNLMKDLVAFATEEKLLDMKERLNQGGRLWVPTNS